MAEATTAVIDQTPKILETIVQLQDNPMVAVVFILVLGGLVAFTLKLLLGGKKEGGGVSQTSHGQNSPNINSGGHVHISHGEHSPIIQAGRDVKINSRPKDP